MSYGRIQRGRMGGDSFTQVANALFRDKRISFKAKGVFGLISTHRDGYGVSVAAICAMGKDKEASVKGALRELEEYGYLFRRQEKDPATKKFGAMVYFITDQPDPKNPRSDHLEPLVDSEPSALTWDVTDHEPLVENALAANPLAEKSPHKKTNPEGVVLRATPGGTKPEEHSLRAPHGEARERAESEPGGGPSIAEIAGPGTSVATEVVPGHGGECSCGICRAIRMRLGRSVPRQPVAREKRQQQQPPADAVGEFTEDEMNRMMDDLFRRPQSEE